MSSVKVTRFRPLLDNNTSFSALTIFFYIRPCPLPVLCYFRGCESAHSS